VVATSRVRLATARLCFARLKTIACEDISPEATGLVADVHAFADQWK
jgi:hypothetical protein